MLKPHTSTATCSKANLSSCNFGGRCKKQVRRGTQIAELTDLQSRGNRKGSVRCSVYCGYIYKKGCAVFDSDACSGQYLVPLRGLEDFVVACAEDRIIVSHH